ncbi:pro-neuropeptide Y-like [Aricia agestis]|uniref:pro-neuropeptide Y-like n=1 Tax=Aricia agestis TaxID=91739 RepID=UPI001C20C1D3|nr:pro-neuropeptide Y-like [Aricia agestis]XP_041981727.1 pro-neuropeptide Y-like [Aricia agestis]
MRLLLPAILLLSAILSSVTLAQYQRPRRPERFHNPQDLSNYLKELRDYYSVHGRGRYGKRRMDTPYFELPSNEDVSYRSIEYQ